MNRANLYDYTNVNNFTESDSECYSNCESDSESDQEIECSISNFSIFTSSDVDRVMKRILLMYGNYLDIKNAAVLFDFLGKIEYSLDKNDCIRITNENLTICILKEIGLYNSFESYLLKEVEKVKEDDESNEVDETKKVENIHLVFECFKCDSIIYILESFSNEFRLTLHTYEIKSFTSCVPYFNLVDKVLSIHSQIEYLQHKCNEIEEQLFSFYQ